MDRSPVVLLSIPQDPSSVQEPSTRCSHSPPPLLPSSFSAPQTANLHNPLPRKRLVSVFINSGPQECFLLVARGPAIMLSGQEPVEGEGGWKRIASQLENEVSRLHRLLEHANQANVELEKQSSRLTKLEVDRGVYNPGRMHLTGANHVGGGDDDDEQPHSAVMAALSSSQQQQQQQQQQRPDSAFLPRPHSRASSPVVLPVAAGGLPPQGLQPLPVAANRGGPDMQYTSRGGWVSSVQQYQQQQYLSDVEALKGQVAWHERERAKAAQQVNRLYDEVEEARAESAHLRQLLHEKGVERSRHDKAMEERREEIRERQERIEAMQAERDDLAVRVVSLEKEKMEMRQHITKLDMYLVNMARELDESRDDRAQLKDQLKQMASELERREAQVTDLNQDLHTLVKWVTRAQGTKKSFDRVLENLQATVDRLKAADVEVVMTQVCQYLSSGHGEQQQHGGGGGQLPALVEGLVTSVRKVSHEVQSVAIQLADEVSAGRRESDFIANDLTDLTTRLRKAMAKVQQQQQHRHSSSSQARHGRRKDGTDGGGGEEEGLAPLSERLRILDETADETGQHLRDLVRARVSHVQRLLRTAYEAKADLVAENERLKREGKGMAARIAILEEDLARLRKDAGSLTEQLGSLTSKQKAAEEVIHLQDQELVDLRPRVSEAEEESASLRDAVEQLRSTLSDVMANKGRVEAELSRIQDLVSSRAVDLDAAGEENAVMHDRMQRLTDVAEEARRREREACEALEAELSRRDGLLAMMAACRSRAATARVFATWRLETVRASMRQWRLFALFRAATLISEERGEVERLEAEVDDLGGRLGAAMQEGLRWKAKVVEVEGRVEKAVGIVKEKVGEVLHRRREREVAAAVLREWSHVVREVKGERRREFHGAFVKYVAGKRLRLERERAVELEHRLKEREEEMETEVGELRRAMEVWKGEGADAEQVAQMEQHTRCLEGRLEQAQVEAERYREELERLREMAEERERELMQQVREQEEHVRRAEEQMDVGMEQNEGELLALSTHVQALEAKVKELATQREEDRMYITQLEEEVSTLRLEVEEEDAKREFLEAERAASSSTMLSEMEAMQGELASLEQQVAEREERVLEMQSQAEGMGRRVEELQEALVKEREAHVQVQRRWEEESHRLQSDSSLRLSGQKERMSTLERERDEALDEVDRLMQQVRRAEEERGRWAAKQREMEDVLCATRDEYLRLEGELAVATDALERSQQGGGGGVVLGSSHGDGGGDEEMTTTTALVMAARKEGGEAAAAAAAPEGLYAPYSSAILSSPRSEMSEGGGGGSGPRPIFSSYGAEPEDSHYHHPPTDNAMASSLGHHDSSGGGDSHHAVTAGSDVMELGARLMRSEADRAELSRQLDEAKREVARLSREVYGMIATLREEGNAEEGELRARIEELEREVVERRAEAEELMQEAAAEGQKELSRLKEEVAYASKRAQDVVKREEQIQALCREMEEVKAANAQMQETVQLQNEELNRLMERQPRSGGEAAPSSSHDPASSTITTPYITIRDLRAKITALEEENDRLRERLAEAMEEARAARTAGGGEHARQVALPQAASSSQEVIRALATTPVNEAELHSVHRALEASEEEKRRLREQLRAVTEERDEFQKLCQNLRDEILAVAEQTCDASGRSPSPYYHHHDHDGGGPTLSMDGGGGGSAMNNPSTTSPYVSPTQVDMFRRQVMMKEQEVEHLRTELNRELSLRRQLEEEGERVRMEREERANLVTRELGEALRQRDQAAHTAHSLEVALRRSQERIDYLIHENSSIKDGLTALESRIVRYSSTSSKKTKKTTTTRRQEGKPQHQQQQGSASSSSEAWRRHHHHHQQRLLVDDEEREEGHASSLDVTDTDNDPAARRHTSSLSLEPEWSPSSNAALRGGLEGMDYSDDDGDDDDGGRSRRRGGDDEEEDEEREQYELTGSWGGRAFLVGSSRVVSGGSRQQQQQQPHGNKRSHHHGSKAAPTRIGQDKASSSSSATAPGEGARQEVLRMLHNAETELQAAVQRKLPVDPALKDYIHELRDALRRLEEADEGSMIALRQQQQTN